MKKLIKNAYKEIDPSQKQVDKMFNNILDRHGRKDVKVIVVNQKKKILTTSVAFAACAALTICLGVSIYKNAQDLKISNSGDSTDSMQEADPTSEDNTPDENDENSDNPVDPQYFSSTGNKKYINGKTYYVGREELTEQISYINVNLLDLTVTELPEFKAVNGSCVYGNTLYSLENGTDDKAPVLYVSDINTGEIINKKDLEYNYEHVDIDKSGNIYLCSTGGISKYSKDLELIYSLSDMEISTIINDNTDNTEPRYNVIDEIRVSPEGEIYIGIHNQINNTMNLCKLDSDHNIVFTSNNFCNSNMGTCFTNLYFLDNGNLLTCSNSMETYGVYGDQTYINEISIQTGEIIADHGQLEKYRYDVLYDNCLYGNCIIFNDYQNKYICKYDFNSGETENIYYYGKKDDISVSNILINGDNVMIKLNDLNNQTNSNTLYIEDSDGNIIKEIDTLRDDTESDNPIYGSIEINSLDVTDDDNIYYIYMTSQYCADPIEGNPGVELKYEVCTINSDDKPVKLFEIPFIYYAESSPVLSADSDQHIYICTTDSTAKATLNVYDTSGTIKSTVDIPENITHISKSILSGSELLLAGTTADNNKPCYISVDLKNMQPGEITLIENNSDNISGD